MRARYHGEIGSIGIETEGLTGERFGFMFGDLAKDDANRLVSGRDTIAALNRLGVAMAADPSNETSDIPAAYTYFGQFIDHDATKTDFDRRVTSKDIFNVIQLEEFTVLTPEQVKEALVNRRSGHLDLDSLYGPETGDAIGDDGTMALGRVVDVPPGARPIRTRDADHDLPRRPMNPADQVMDRKAKIGDERNDENLIIAQMHVAFLRAHNVILKRNSFDIEKTKSDMRRRYQWTVLHDFLPRICDKSVIEDIHKNGATVWQVNRAEDLFTPVEFSGAAYRFGHSMVRQSYEFNDTFRTGGLAPGDFNFMFTFTALSGDLQPGDGASTEFANLPRNWIIDWARFFGNENSVGGENAARRIDTKIAPELSLLRGVTGNAMSGVMGQLAARNLLRGYLLGLPTGQAVAGKLGIPALSREDLLDVLPVGERTPFERAGFVERTPLWFYVLAEAERINQGNSLGPVGSRIVAETLWNQIKFSPDSVVVTPPTEEELASGEFSLAGIISLGLDADLPAIHRGSRTARLD